MNKSHIEMLIKVAIIKGEVKKSIEIAERYKVSPKRYGVLVKQVDAVAR